MKPSLSDSYHFYSCGDQKKVAAQIRLTHLKKCGLFSVT